MCCIFWPSPLHSSFSIETRWKVTRTGARSVSVTAYVEGQFNKWLFGFKSSVETLIKKDGVAYVSGLLARMKSLASPRKVARVRGPGRMCC